MHNIRGSDITLTRGDTLYLELEITSDGQPYEPAEGDVIRFAMKRKFKDPDEDVLINKVIPNDSLVSHIAPADTKGLEMGKTYVYDIELTDASGNVDTFISGTFTITGEVL